MTVDPRAALDRFTAALEAHLTTVMARRGDDDPAVDDAYYVLADAFEVYDDALAVTFAEATPFYLAEEDDEDDLDDSDDESDDDDNDDDHDDHDDDDHDDHDDEDDADLDDDDLDDERERKRLELIEAQDNLEGLTASDLETLLDPERG